MPAPGIELITVETWLRQRLASNLVGVQNRVFVDAAPRGTQYPYVIYQLQTPEDVRTLNGTRIMTTGTWIVKAIMQTATYADLSSIAAAIDSQLHKAQYHTDVGSGAVLACVRERPFKMSEVNDGLLILHLGGFYRIYAQ